ncbi:hypothetical protein METP1_01520 [Methanosarcinales archaeon]|nr:hypothetical protein METP1_01520 [Methanosarcinales archaeon]
MTRWRLRAEGEAPKPMKYLTNELLSELRMVLNADTRADIYTKKCVLPVE